MRAANVMAMSKSLLLGRGPVRWYVWWVCNVIPAWTCTGDPSGEWATLCLGVTELVGEDTPIAL